MLLKAFHDCSRTGANTKSWVVVDCFKTFCFDPTWDEDKYLSRLSWQLFPTVVSYLCDTRYTVSKCAMCVGFVFSHHCYKMVWANLHIYPHDVCGVPCSPKTIHIYLYMYILFCLKTGYPRIWSKWSIGGYTHCHTLLHIPHRSNC